uniref:Uncharacterized protein n=1 Tax=Anguilla anguilla TaxID=7936 RepID=A0A0E9TW02_ANGAN
MTKLFKTRC